MKWDRVGDAVRNAMLSIPEAQRPRLVRLDICMKNKEGTPGIQVKVKSIHRWSKMPVTYGMLAVISCVCFVLGALIGWWL